MNNQKQITTVYVLTDESQGSFTLDDLNKTMVINTKAYLYTPEEHAAVQGYREAFEKIEHYATNLPNKETACIQIKHIVKSALSKAEDKGEEFETSYGEVLSTIRTPIEEPTNSLDELERWVKYLEENQRFFTIIRTDDLLAKIQELKTITT